MERHSEYPSDPGSKIIHEGITFDDVLLIPEYSSVTPDLADTSTLLTRNIRLNTDLAKKPRECLEYILVHEMVHLLEPTHNARFVALMDQFMPRWRFIREVLNRLPVRHERWTY